MGSAAHSVGNAAVKGLYSPLSRAMKTLPKRMGASARSVVTRGLRPMGSGVKKMAQQGSRSAKSIASKTKKSVGDGWTRLKERVQAPKLCKLAQAGCFAAGTLVMTGASSQPIEDVQLGQRVLTNIEQRSDDATQREAFACPTEVDENWRRLTLILEDPNEGPDFIAESLRSPEWMRSHHAEVGGTVWFELSELNIAGYARILEIDDAPLIEEGPGCVVLSRYTRVNDNLISLSLGDGDVLHLTDTHRLYSASRDQWVAAGALWEGEYLRGAYATVPVDGLDWHEGAEPVFNLEVESAHRYLVGDAGVLAHNANNCKPGAGGAAKGEETALKDFNQARNSALEWLEARGFKAEQATVGKFGKNAGRPIGMKTADGKVGFRVEYDARNGAHINVWAGKEKGPHITFEGDQALVDQLVKQFVK